MNLSVLPAEIINNILCHLPLRYRFRFRLVCRLWYRLFFSNVTEFAIGSRELMILDAHESMFNHLFCDDESDRVRFLIFMLNNTKHRLTRLKLSFINRHFKRFIEDDYNEVKAEKYNRLLDEMVSLLIQCSQLTSIHFDHDFCLPKDKFETIYRHLGPQLVEVICDDDSSLEFSYELAMKYLDPVKIRKLTVSSWRSEYNVERFFRRFSHLSSFSYVHYHDFNTLPNPFNVQHLNLVPNLTEINIQQSNCDEVLPNISQSVFASNLISLRCWSVFQDSHPYSKFKSLRHLQIDLYEEAELAIIAQQLPQLESFGVNCGGHDPKESFVSISKLKNLKMLKLVYDAKKFGKIAIDPMTSLLCLIIGFPTDFDKLIDYVDEVWPSIAISFPNLKCLDIQCPTIKSDLVLAALSRLPRLTRFRLHTQNPTEKSFLCPRAALLARQQVKLFCDQNQIEFLWSHYNRYTKIGQFRHEPNRPRPFAYLLGHNYFRLLRLLDRFPNGSPNFGWL